MYINGYKFNIIYKINASVIRNAALVMKNNIM